MPGMTGSPKKVVLLVDNKRRDLLSAALIARQLKGLGIQPFLEPIEAYRAVLAGWRPDLIVFNHLLASHLANYSGRLSEMGVKVAVLPNESLLYNREVMRFNCRRYNDRVHVDLYFCWNEVQKECLIQNGYSERETRIELVGNPKFDFYFEPWSRLYAPANTARPHKRPRILVCTNFGFAAYKELPRIEADRLFDIWRKHIAIYERYWEAIEINHRSRARFLDYLKAILQTDKYDVVLRPHPGEPAAFYRQWISGLDSDLASHIRLGADESIYSLILNCDLEVSCETCTTAIESWLCGKPTIELIFERFPMFYHPEVAELNVECEAPELLPGEIERQLADPAQSPYRPARDAHLARWCHSPRGDSCARVARAIAETVKETVPSYAGRLEFHDHRRGLKLRLLETVGLPCNYDPLLSVKGALWARQYREKLREYEKTIKPADVVRAQNEIEACVV